MMMTAADILLLHPPQKEGGYMHMLADVYQEVLWETHANNV